jgi:hypothetical protein
MSLDLIRIRSGQQIYRSIVLPMRGNVLVRTGQHLKVGDIIAEYTLPEHFLVFDVVNGLKIDASKLDTHLLRLVGEQVEAGDVIAQKSGLFSRIFRAPQDGRVISILDGKVTLALGTKKITCSANFPGVVVELIPDRGAVIGGSGAVLQGVWGNGLNAQGMLAYLGGSDQNPFDQTVIGPDLAKKIVVMGYCTSDAILGACVKSEVAGLIVSALAPQLQSRAQELEIPLMCLSGFGDINLDAYSEGMVLMMMGHEVFLNAHVPDLYAGVRPEVIMPTDQITYEGLFVEENRLRVGSKVRLVGKPYTGGVGEIIDLPDEKERFASGLWIQPVVVKRVDGEIIHIPITNIEVIVD